MIVSSWMLLSFLLFIGDDSIMFNLSQDEDEAALRLIKKVYHPDEDSEAILFNLKLQCHKKATT